MIPYYYLIGVLTGLLVQLNERGKVPIFELVYIVLGWPGVWLAPLFVRRFRWQRVYCTHNNGFDPKVREVRCTACGRRFEELEL